MPCSGNEYNLPIDQNLCKQDFPSHPMVFLSAHLLAACTKHSPAEMKPTCPFSARPHPRYASMLKEGTGWK